MGMCGHCIYVQCVCAGLWRAIQKLARLRAPCATTHCSDPAPCGAAQMLPPPSAATAPTADHAWWDWLKPLPALHTAHCFRNAAVQNYRGAHTHACTHTGAGAGASKRGWLCAPAATCHDGNEATLAGGGRCHDARYNTSRSGTTQSIDGAAHLKRLLGANKLWQAGRQAGGDVGTWTLARGVRSICALLLAHKTAPTAAAPLLRCKGLLPVRARCTARRLLMPARGSAATLA